MPAEVVFAKQGIYIYIIYRTTAIGRNRLTVTLCLVYCTSLSFLSEYVVMCFVFLLDDVSILVVVLL
jgi:hypothetical protein